MAPFTATSPTTTDQLWVDSPPFDQKLSGRGRTINASSTSLCRRLTATPVVLVLMLLSLFGAAIDDPINPATAINPLAATVEVVFTTKVTSADHKEHEYPAPGNHPHCSHWANVRSMMVESSPCQSHQGVVVDYPSQQHRTPAPWHEALAVPALTASRTPAALQVFRS